MKMKGVRSITIFHLFRKDGTALFLHPFDDPNVFLSVGENTQIYGKYGQEPDVEYITLFRSQLYQSVETTVKSWIQDKKFIPNFLWASTGFLLIYFLFTFAVRDPLPMVDELLIAAASAVGIYFYRLRKTHALPQAEELRKKLRWKVDHIEFQEDAFVQEVEDILHRYESVSRDKLLESMYFPDTASFTDKEIKDAQKLIDYLEKRFSSKAYRRQEKLMDRYATGEGSPRRFESLKAQVDRGKIDLSLLATYRSLKRRVHVH